MVWRRCRIVEMCGSEGSSGGDGGGGLRGWGGREMWRGFLVSDRKESSRLRDIRIWERF